MNSFKPISCILIHLEMDNVLRTKRANVAVRDYSNAQYEPFPPFLYPTPRAMRGRNDGLIRAPIITENDGFLISKWSAIRIREVFSLRSPQAEAAISRLSPFMAIQTQALSLLRKTKDRNSSSSSRGRRPFACSFNQALTVQRETPNVRSIPRILDLFLDKLL